MSASRRSIRATLLGSVLLLVAMVQPVTIAAQTACDPFETTPEYLPSVPTATDVLGFALGSQEVTSAGSDTYLDAVDAASDRVVAGTAATSWEGRPLRYAIVGDPATVTPEGSQPRGPRDRRASVGDRPSPPGSGTRAWG